MCVAREEHAILHCRDEEMCKKLGAQVEYRDIIKKARENYKPRGETRVLFVAESPPPQKGNANKDDLKFFYNPKTGPTSLFCSLRKLLAECNLCIGKDENAFLDKFRHEFYLIDAVSCPLEKNALKEDLADMCEENLKHQIKDLQPKIIFTLGRIATDVIVKRVVDMKSHLGKCTLPEKTRLNPEGAELIISSVLPLPRNKNRGFDLLKPFQVLQENLRGG